VTRASDNAMIPVAVEGDGDYFTNAENVRYRAVDTHGRDLWLEVGRLTGHGALSAFSLTGASSSRFRVIEHSSKRPRRPGKTGHLQRHRTSHRKCLQ